MTILDRVIPNCAWSSLWWSNFLWCNLVRQAHASFSVSVANARVSPHACIIHTWAAWFVLITRPCPVVRHRRSGCNSQTTIRTEMTLAMMVKDARRKQREEGESQSCVQCIISRRQVDGVVNLLAGNASAFSLVSCSALLHNISSLTWPLLMFAFNQEARRSRTCPHPSLLHCLARARTTRGLHV